MLKGDDTLLVFTLSQGHHCQVQGANLCADLVSNYFLLLPC